MQEFLVLFMIIYAIYQQRTKNEYSYSYWQYISTGVLKRAIIWPLLSDINSCNLLFITDVYKIANCADKNMPYVVVESLYEVVTSIEKASHILFNRFCSSPIEAKAGKSVWSVMYWLIFISINISNADVVSCKFYKLLGANIDSKLSFEKNINHFCF